MPGLTDEAGDTPNGDHDPLALSQKRWENSMLLQIEQLRRSLRPLAPEGVARHTGADYSPPLIHLRYWQTEIQVAWPDLLVRKGDGSPCSTFDQAMVLYYLLKADGSPLADRWIGFRDLPNGAFYNQAFQGYTGDRLARAFGEEPAGFAAACRSMEGWSLPAIGDHAYAFLPLPRIRLAAVLWPGDEEFPARASVVFDGAASHYMTTDGLALLGSGLVGRLIKAAGLRSG